MSNHGIKSESKKAVEPYARRSTINPEVRHEIQEYGKNNSYGR